MTTPQTLDRTGIIALAIVTMSILATPVVTTLQTLL